MDIDIYEPLELIPFQDFKSGIEVPIVKDWVRNNATVRRLLHNMHLCPRSAELRWNKALKEDDIEPEHDVYSEEVLPPAE